ncbi:hypothetical protein [Actinomycetia phage DSL-LC01]|nr:hypothetical protein [Actinomycetia phage DSL-LC01]
MPKVDFEWVRSQMQDAKVRIGTGKAVLKLLEAWNDIPISDKMSKDAIEVFSNLALTKSIVEDQSDDVWIEARPGALQVGDIVKVRHDAYEGEPGVIHNGRKGKITGIRYGDIVVRTTDDKVPFIDGAHHSPHKLLKKV